MDKSFVHLFWSSDYQTGLDKLFDKLHQGCAENNQVLDMVTHRVQLERSYASGLTSFPSKHAPSSTGFNRDEGATLRQSYVAILDDLCEQGSLHDKVASNIENGVRKPFDKWATAHKNRVQLAQSAANSKIKSYNRQLIQVGKIQQTYFARCRDLEDTDVPAQTQSSNGLSSLTSRLRAASVSSDKSASSSSTTITPLPTSSQVEIAGKNYTPQALGNLLYNMTQDINTFQYKVPIIGTYDHVSTGAEIVLWARQRMDFSNVAGAEKFGQGLVDHGFLRAVGRVGNRFTNSSSSYYQWTPKALDYDSDKSNEEEQTTPVISVTSPTKSYFSSLLSSAAGSKEAPKIRQEVDELDQQYRDAVKRLDEERCELERLITDTLNFMQQCESDRIAAVKTVFKDFASAISVHLEADQEKKVLLRLSQHQQAVNPLSDLKYMIDSYKVGTFRPTVVAYENYHSPSVQCQSFGIELAHVSYFIPQYLEYLELQQDTTVKMWTHDEPLNAIHKLRAMLNTGELFDPATTLFSFDTATVVSTFKEFLIELPDSLISHAFYDIFKSTYSIGSDDSDRLEKVESTLRHLPTVNLESLEKLAKYFGENLKLDTDSEGLCAVSSAIGPIILRPRVQTVRTMNDRHTGQLLKDLIKHRNTLFPNVYKVLEENRSERRSRSLSSSEAHRRAHMEARNKEIAARSRSGAVSPNRSGQSSPNGRLQTPSGGGGLRPLTLSPSNSPTSSTKKTRARISSTSLMTPPKITRHQKSLSTPIKGVVLSPPPHKRTSADLKQGNKAVVPDGDDSTYKDSADESVNSADNNKQTVQPEQSPDQTSAEDSERENKDIGEEKEDSSREDGDDQMGSEKKEE
uniref:ARAD1D06600p n=1 Tax=Blastobotrys adeninivorans TaxID=409370 RepID=A0A060TEE3_BLAAD